LTQARQLPWRCGLALTLLLPSGCLPDDTRPPPSRVLFTASPSPDTRAGALSTPTADGWRITFTRVLVSLGRVSLDGDDCSVYSEARYGRVLSLVGAPHEQKISESYALGSCDFGFAIGNAASDSLLGAGATVSDLDFLRTAGSDRYQTNRGTSLFVAGSAEKGERQLSFAWAFRGRARYRACQTTENDAAQGRLVLEEDGDVTANVTLRAEALFAEDVTSSSSALRFDAIASADALGNADGEVTLDELGLVPLRDLQLGTTYTNGEPGRGEWTTLEDFIYLGTAPGVAHYEETGRCEVGLGDMPGPG